MSVPAPTCAQRRPLASIDPGDFDYELPEELVASHPPAERSAARLMRVCGGISHGKISGLPRLLDPGDLLVLNDTKVRKARLRGRKEGGGKVEILVGRIDKGGLVASAMLRSSGGLQPGATILAGGVSLRVAERNGRLSTLEMADGPGFEQLLEREGEVPLPPYLGRPPTSEDLERYQTVYARPAGSCAAPTAGLHFTPDLLAALRFRGIVVATLTLHVGFGTFMPLEAGAEELHPEQFNIPQPTLDAVGQALDAGRRVVACGTTALRALESGAREGETRLFIRPGFEFRRATTLLTNFHLPRSSLFVLACAFGGEQTMRKAYRTAVAERYRFFSYGDAMLADRHDLPGRR